MDQISRIYCKDFNLRAYTVTSLNLAREITTLHETTPNATIALGRSINAAALLSATLKPDSKQNILLKFSGSGPIKEIHVQVDTKGNLRGYVANPLVDLSGEMDTISFSKAIGAGLLTVIKDSGRGEPYYSVTPLMNGEVAADLAWYLTTSEQIPSAVILGLNLNKEGIIISSGGILIQTFPDTEESAIIKIEENINKMKKPLGDMLADGAEIYSIVSEIFENKSIEIMGTTPLKHTCKCNKEMLLKIIKGINKEEIIDMIEKDNGAEITCTFCKKTYNMSAEELKNFL